MSSRHRFLFVSQIKTDIAFSQRYNNNYWCLASVKAKSMPSNEVIDKESQEILDEMKQDGIPVEGDEPEVKTEPKVEPKGEPEVKVEEPKDEVKTESEEDEEEPEYDSGRPQRIPQTVPLPKYMKLKDEVADLKGKLEEINKSNQPKEQKDEEIEAVIGSISQELAEDLGLDKSKLEGAFGKLANSIMAKSKMPEAVAEVFKKAQEREAWAKEEDIFNQEVKALQTEFPDEKINKDTLHELAFNEKFSKKSLYEIYFRNIKPDQSEEKKKKSAESAKGGTDKSKKIVDLTKDLSSDEILELSDEEFDELSKEKSKGQSSRTIYDHHGNKIG